jgi:hypothetical protein
MILKCTKNSLCNIYKLAEFQIVAAIGALKGYDTII